MFGLGKGGKPAGIPFPLHFKDAEAAVEYASKYMICDLKPGIELPAFVINAADAFGTGQAVSRGANGIQTAMLKVCGTPGPFTAIAQTSGAQGPELKAGDLVSWSPFQFIAEMAAKAADRRTGWAGLIVGVLEPTLFAEGWLGKSRFLGVR